MNAVCEYVTQFAETAGAFCAWCESPASEGDREVQAAVWLARLHSAALLLPSAEPENEDGLPELPRKHLDAATSNLRYFAGWYYRTLFDPDPVNCNEPVIGDVGDDLLDTYKDVKAGLLLYVGGSLENALWHWSFMHEVHWGKHAVDAMVALQAHRSRVQSPA